MEKTLPSVSDSHGGMRYALFNSTDLDFTNKAMPPSTWVKAGAKIPISGWQHFQVWFRSADSVNVGCGLIPLDPVTGALETGWIALTTWTPTLQWRTFYWGVGLDPPASAAGDKIRFGRFVQLAFKNNDAVVATTGTAYLEAMG